MSPNQNDKELPPNAPFLEDVGKQLQLLQEERGDDKLMLACDLVTSEVRNAIPKRDLNVIEDKITS